MLRELVRLIKPYYASIKVKLRTRGCNTIFCELLLMFDKDVYFPLPFSITPLTEFLTKPYYIKMMLR